VFIPLRPALLAAATLESNSRAIILSVARRCSEVVFDNINLVGDYEKWKGYGQSKCALLLAAEEIDRRYSSQGLRAFSAQPVVSRVDFYSLYQRRSKVESLTILY
jgi:NAD(P)-dependent dehydrogenase (short-subunit alcohol dehydrogenase family)